MKTYYVYILANRKHGALYIGVTNHLIRRVHEHKEGVVEGFTQTYGLKTLVWFDSTGSVEGAIQTEKRLKNRKREWKIALIEKANPGWKDLYPGLL